MPDKETLEDFVQKVSPQTKLYLYLSGENTFLSPETLNELYGDVFFIESSIPTDKSNSFNLELAWITPEYYDEHAMIKALKETIQHHLYRKNPILRLGYVKCLMSENFEPFHETINRLFTQCGLKDLVRQEAGHSIVFTCVDGYLFRSI